MTSAFEKQIEFPAEASESIRKAWTDPEYRARVIKNDIERRKNHIPIRKATKEELRKFMEAIDYNNDEE